jgi:hypothetical protein
MCGSSVHPVPNSANESVVASLTLAIFLVQFHRILIERECRLENLSSKLKFTSGRERGRRVGVLLFSVAHHYVHAWCVVVGLDSSTLDHSDSEQQQQQQQQQLSIGT